MSADQDQFEVLLGDGRGLGAGEHMPVHGLVDIAAGRAGLAWRTSDSAAALGTLAQSIKDASLLVASEQLQLKADTAVNTLEFSGEDAARHGARLGYALARTIDAAGEGWAAWERAAREWLASSGCDLDAHTSELLLGYQRDAHDVDEAVASARALSSGTSAGAAAPAPTLMQIGAAVERTCLDFIADHVSEHHADSAPDPAAPKARPTVKRQPAASRAATAPPVRHRAHDSGHVAAAVPLVDQCAGDDLEIAGHRHPRADDAWVASLG